MGDLFSSRNERIKVPSYQRRFSWGEEHFEDLWNDLDAIDAGESHFFGTIVFMSKTHVAQTINEMDVVDGQQRITTVSILLCAIGDYLEEEYEYEVEDRIENLNKSLWLVDRDGNKRGMRLVLGNLDKESYENLIMSNFDEIENERIREAYDYFYGNLKELDLEEIKKLHDKTLDQLIYVSITAKGHTDAYHLFEAMNNRGLSLSPIDLMKNYLLMRASERNDLSEDRIERLWGDIIKNLDSLSDVNKPAITFFRQYFMSSPLLDIKEKITENKLYDPTFIESIDESEDVEGLLRDIKQQSELYRKMLTQNIDMFNDSQNAEINRYLRDTKTVSITTFTLLLRAFRELESPDDIKEVMRMANALLVRRQICDRNTGRHDTFFNHLAQNAFEEDDPLAYIKEYLRDGDKFPDNDQFKGYFAEENFSNNDRTKYILSKIEEEHFGHGGMEVVESRYQVHIEHILPQRYGKNLQRLWLDPFDISRRQHNEFKKKIGNLTLLEEDPNIRASNRTLEEKQRYYTEDQTDFKMTHQLVHYDEWGVEQIQDRSKRLAEIAVDIWSL